MEEFFSDLVNVFSLFFVEILLIFGFVDIVSEPANTKESKHFKNCFDMKDGSGFVHIGLVNDQLSCFVVILSLPAVLVFQHILFDNVAEHDLCNDLKALQTIESIGSLVGLEECPVGW